MDGLPTPLMINNAMRLLIQVLTKQHSLIQAIPSTRIFELDCSQTGTKTSDRPPWGPGLRASDLLFYSATSNCPDAMTT
eukprot:1409213-Amphidinium_carterae.1